MKNSSVRFYGPIRSSSGYGNAVRCFASAFSGSSVDTKFCFSTKDSDRDRKFVDGLDSYSGSCGIDFYLQPPPWNRHKSSNYKIAYFYWEADRLPSYWVKSLNTVDEIWAPCNLVKDACRRAGFKGPMHIVPTPTDYNPDSNKILIPAPNDDGVRLGDDVFKFYSIFQWHHRKGPDVLLKSYWDEFGPEDNVVLLLKVNPLKSGSADIIKGDIYNIKKLMKRRYYAPVYVTPWIISKDKISGIHSACHAYVSPHRGEGWGLPIHDAMCAGNNIITTKFGGITDFLSKNSANIISHNMANVSNMEWSPHVYSSRQRWANPSRLSLCRNMRDVYTNYSSSVMMKKRTAARKIGASMSIDGVSYIIEKLLRGGRRA